MLVNGATGSQTSTFLKSYRVRVRRPLVGGDANRAPQL